MLARLALVAGLVVTLGNPPSVRADCLDHAFAVNGWSLEPRGSAAALVRQPDGKLVVAGFSERSAGTLSADDFLVARYDAAGTLDPTFGSGGSVVTPPIGGPDDARATALALQADGKLVVVGSVIRFTGVPPTQYDPPQIAIVRYQTDGTLDSSFGNGGIVVSSFPSGTRASGVVVQPDGTIVVGGTSSSGPSGLPQFFFARYDSGGGLDPTFGTAGSTVLGTRTTGNALVRESDGKLAIAGFVTPGGIDSFALGRVDADGVPDAGFGTGGVVITNASPSSGQNEALALVEQSDGKLVAAGFAYGRGFTLVRYASDGSLDPTFGTGGIASTILGAVPFGLTIDSAERLVVAGDHYNGLHYAVTLARFTVDGAPDASFNGTGVVTTDFNTDADDVAQGVVVDPDGGIVVAGWSSATVLVARYLGEDCSCQPPNCSTTTVGTSSTTMGTSSTTSTTAPPACVTLAGRNRLRMVRKPGASDRLVWRWSHSLSPLDPADIGNPAAGTVGYDLQLFDGSFGGREVVHWPYFSPGTCGSLGCWTATGHGYKFTSFDLGIQVTMRSGLAGQGQLRLRWRHDGFLPVLPLTPPVEMRFTRSDGRTCFVSRFSGASIHDNTALVFDGR